MLVTAYIGVGSNLDSPLDQVESAINALSHHRHLHNVKTATIYGSKPVGPQDQPDYVNTVVELKTHLLPHHLLDLLQSIEQQHGRERKRHWGERTLDLDLILYGSAIIRTPRLTVPHAFMQERSFVLYPLADLNPELVLPEDTPLQQCIKQVPFDLFPV